MSPPLQHQLSPRPSGPELRRRRAASSFLIGLAACLTVVSGCSRSSSTGDDLVSDTTAVPVGTDRNGSDGSGELGAAFVGGLDELTYADDRPVLDPDGPPDVERPELASPDERLDTMRGTEVADAIEQAAASPDVAILDVAGIVDDGPTAEEVASFGDGNTRGPTGELVILDENASLACADIEIALNDLDEGRTADAADHLVSAAERSGRSSVAGISAWSNALGIGADGGREGAVDAVTMVGFLSVCVDGGYVL